MIKDQGSRATLWVPGDPLGPPGTSCGPTPAGRGGPGCRQVPWGTREPPRKRERSRRHC